jgi:fructokinase
MQRTPLPDLPRSSPIVFGEVLFDLFESGEAALGGAAFNVAWGLKGLGLEPLFISRVGDDALGRRVLEAMESWGLETAGMQVDPELPTGRVEVRIAGRAGEPEFRIPPDQAYDRIDAAAALEAARAVAEPILYHGTLAARSPLSQAALEALKRLPGARRFVDLNLRAPWWERAGARAELQGAAWGKVNEAELAQVSALDHAAVDARQAALALEAELGLELLVVTRGAEGALIARRGGGLVEGRPPEVAEVVDTVGAGDAFSAAMLLGLHRLWPLAACLRGALELAAAVCGLRGATSDERDFYAVHAVRWEAGVEATKGA